MRLLTHDAFAVSPEVLAEFTRESGLHVDVVKSGDAGVLVNQAILRKDHPSGDVLFGIDNTFLTRAFDAGLFEPYTPPGLALAADVPVDDQHRVTPIDQGDVCVDYDLSWFGHGGHPAAPASLADLADARYKNLTVVENAATSSPGLAFLLATIAHYGDTGWREYWRSLRKNGVRVVNDWTQAYEGDFTAGGGTGDRPIVVSYASSPPADVVYSSPHRDRSRVGVASADVLPAVRIRRCPARHEGRRWGAQARRLLGVAPLPGGHAAPDVRRSGAPGRTAASCLQAVGRETRAPVHDAVRGDRRASRPVDRGVDRHRNPVRAIR